MSDTVLRETHARLFRGLRESPPPDLPVLYRTAAGELGWSEVPRDNVYLVRWEDRHLVRHFPELRLACARGSDRQANALGLRWLAPRQVVGHEGPDPRVGSSTPSARRSTRDHA